MHYAHSPWLRTDSQTHHKTHSDFALINRKVMPQKPPNHSIITYTLYTLTGFYSTEHSVWGQTECHSPPTCTTTETCHRMQLFHGWHIAFFWRCTFVRIVCVCLCVSSVRSIEAKNHRLPKCQPPMEFMVPNSADVDWRGNTHKYSSTCMSELLVFD